MPLRGSRGSDEQIANESNSPEILPWLRKYIYSLDTGSCVLDLGTQVQNTFDAF